MRLSPLLLLAACSSGQAAMPDGGEPLPSFVALPSPTTATLYAVWGSGPGDLFAVGQGDVIVHTATVGQSFSAQFLANLSGRLLSIWGTSDQVFVVGDQGAVLRSTDGGSTFSSLVAPAGDDYTGIFGVPGGALYVVGTRSIIHSADDGTTWQTDKTGSGSAFFGVWGASPNDLYVVGEGGLILHFDGTHFTPENSRVTLPLLAVWGMANDRFVVGESGTILHSSGDGNWTTQESNVHTTLRSIFGVGDGAATVIYLVGDLGSLLRSNDWGAHWTAVPVETETSLYGVWGSAANDLYLVGEGGAILHTGGGGNR